MSLSSFGLGQANNPVYVSTASVRSEAGLDGNTDIIDTKIDRYITQAHARVQSFAAAVYDITLLTTANADFVQSQAESVLVRAEELIAAWYLLASEFGTNDFDDTKKEWLKKVAEWERILMSLYDEKKPLILLDVNGEEFTRKPASNAGTMTLSNTGSDEEAIFTRKMKF